MQHLKQTGDMSGVTWRAAVGDTFQSGAVSVGLNSAAHLKNPLWS